jgi:hypothetical protein
MRMTIKPTLEQKKRAKEILDAARMIGKAETDVGAEELMDRLAIEPGRNEVR